MKHYLGVDAGGTHTRFLMFDEKGNNVDRINRDSIHFMRVGYNGMKKVLQEVKASFEAKGYDFTEVGVAFGMAGYGEDRTVRTNIESTVWDVFPNAILMNDAMFAMSSALSLEDGVYVISGTGSIAFRKNGCENDRRGGFGYLLGDEGSAFWIGKRMLEVFTKEADGRLPRTELYEAIMENYNLTEAYDLIGVANDNKDEYRTWVAEMSGLAAKTDSVHAKEVFERAGLELAGLANDFELNGKTKIAVGGSVLMYNDIVKNTLINNLKSDYEFVESEHPVEYAAYLLFRKN